MIDVDWINGQKANKKKMGLSQILSILDYNRSQLTKISIVKLLDTLESFAASILNRSSKLLKKYPDSGVPFLGRWCGSGNVKAIFNDTFGDITVLDCYKPRKNVKNREIRAFPKGNVVHWMAGNVPTLGLLSLVSGVLTKNSNIVRINSLADLMLADLMHHLSQIDEIGYIMASSVAIVRYDYNDKKIAEELSLSADNRIIWGGDQSTASIKRLPVKPTCTDLVFPDRTSFAVVGEEKLSEDRMPAIARLIAHDISVFEQKACASPHTIFLDTDSSEAIKRFCMVLKDAMEETLKRIPKRMPSQNEVQAIVKMRTRYDMFHDAWYSEGSEFSILSDDMIQLGPAIGNRLVYVRKLPSDEELIKILPDNIQSVGIEADTESFERLTDVLGAAGVHRFTPIGAMTQFEIPWDGFALPQYLIRWTTRPTQK
ncbi:acyl-CoA reductase [Desulfospira joergensenii]|uniref:acyl-CoA reductase n=1 Tax=Desulfospira joergensenii TaxID=53329 RepID=UPI0003B6434C|nr:acyl-CoA reductase [Desulfospira joergensenii]